MSSRYRHSVKRRHNKKHIQQEKPFELKSTVTASRAAVFVPLLVGHLAVAVASPQGGVVVGGAGSIQQSNAQTTLVTQSTSRMAVEWQSFNLAPQDVVQFQQPSSSSVVLNRILDQDPSIIQGRITANGKVFLSNANGLIFTRTSVINVDSLVF